MISKENSMFARLRKGEKIECPICHKGFLEPYNTTADKSYYFTCSNDKCKADYNFNPVINIE